MTQLDHPNGQWLFLVPLIGGRWHIIPQLAGKMPLIYHLYLYIYIAFRGIICHLPPIEGTRNSYWNQVTNNPSERSWMKKPWLRHQSLNRLQQLTELQTLQRFALQTQSIPSMSSHGGFKETGKTDEGCGFLYFTWTSWKSWNWVVLSNIFYFLPLSNWRCSNLINIFQMGWFNHQLVKCCVILRSDLINLTLKNTPKYSFTTCFDWCFRNPNNNKSHAIVNMPLPNKKQVPFCTVKHPQLATILLKPTLPLVTVLTFDSL